jgi:hypothetical protein
MYPPVITVGGGTSVPLYQLPRGMGTGPAEVSLDRSLLFGGSPSTNQQRVANATLALSGTSAVTATQQDAATSRYLFNSVYDGASLEAAATAAEAAAAADVGNAAKALLHSLDHPSNTTNTTTTMTAGPATATTTTPSITIPQPAVLVSQNFVSTIVEASELPTYTSCRLGRLAQRLYFPLPPEISRLFDYLSPVPLHTPKEVRAHAAL